MLCTLVWSQTLDSDTLRRPCILPVLHALELSELWPFASPAYAADSAGLVHAAGSTPMRTGRRTMWSSTCRSRSP